MELQSRSNEEFLLDESLKKRCKRRWMQVLQELKCKFLEGSAVQKLLEQSGIKKGRIPLHTLRADIDYAKDELKQPMDRLG